jgi:predicted amidohydrolase YtcJ
MPVKGKAVLVKGDTIIAVVDNKSLKSYAPEKTLRMPGKFLMPGLWDSHVHFGGGAAEGASAQLIEENSACCRST